MVFSTRHRAFRAAWIVTWGLFGRWSPVPFFAWRRLLLSAFGAQLHARARVYPSVVVWYPPHLVMGAGATLGPRVRCYNMDRVEIAAGALVSQGAYLCGGTRDVDSVDFALRTAPIVINEHAWVASEAFVGPGVTIGARAVLGARAVTFKSLEAGGIYVGNPARLVRRRGG